MGNGHNCESKVGTQTKMSEYMNLFKQDTGNVSLKEEYVAATTKLHDKFEQNPDMDAPLDMGQYVIDTEEEDTEENVNGVKGIPAFISSMIL